MKNLNNTLTEDQQADLRLRSLITEKEFAYVAGDLLVAENAIDGEKRIVGKAALLTEGNKRVLKG